MTDTTLQPDLSVAVLIDDDTLLLFGTCDRPALPGGTATANGEAVGRFDAHCWPREDGGHWLLAALRAPDAGRLQTARIVVAGNEGDALALPRLRAVKVNPWGLLSTLKEEHAAAMPAALDFLLRALAPAEGQPLSARLGKFLSAFVGHIARPDGFAEIFGRLSAGNGTMIQGWSSSLEAGRAELLVETDACRFYRAEVGAFRRPDLPDTAWGLVAVVPAAEDAPEQIRRIFYRSGNRWCELELFAERTLLPDGVALAHLRDLLPRLSADPATLRTLRRRITAVYEGHETVSRLEVPVCAALDRAIRVPGVGTLVTGWLLDPQRHVASVILHGTGAETAIDGDWFRTQRKDVTEGFLNDGRFAGRLPADRHDHGFLAFVPESAGLPEDAAFHLEIALTDGGCAYLPVHPVAPNAELVRHLLCLIDINNPAAESLIERHVGPIVQAAGRVSPDAPAAPVFAMGRTVATPTVSVILPVTDGREDVDLHLARLAIDPDFAQAEILVAAAAGSSDRLALTLRRAASFYKLAVRLVPAPQAHDAFEAMAAALPHAAAEHVLLLSTAVLPTSRGWLSELARAAAAHRRPAMVSPTLLYEDFSIRFAGVRVEGDRPVAQFAGYPREWLKERQPVAVPAATVDCALLPKRLIAEAGGLTAGFVGAEYKSADFCLRLGKAGHACLWVPTVALVAVDEQARTAAHEYWRQTGTLVDRWAFDRQWTPKPANTDLRMTAR